MEEVRLTKNEKEIIDDALTFYASCQSNFVSYGEHKELQIAINAIKSKLSIYN